MKISISELKENVLGLLRPVFSEEHSQQIAECFIWAEMCGIRTQGIVKLNGEEPVQNIRPQHPITIERETKLSQLINAGGWPAPVVSRQATDAVIKKAKDSGFGIVGVHNTFSSNGAQAFYAERIAQADLVGFVAARSPGCTAPFNSIDPLFGTNPLAFAFPALEHPIVFDMATSAVTFYGLILAKARGEKIPPIVAIDHQGNLTQDPAAAMKGAILPFDRSHKGSGLAMAVELLCGPLVGSAFCDYKTFNEEWGALFIAFDPALLRDPADFKRDCSQMLEVIKNSRTKDGSPVRLPGERARASYEAAVRSGVVDVEEALLKSLGFA